MAKTYFAEDDRHILNHIRSRKLGDGYLVTTDHGSWAYLTEDEYRQLGSRIKQPLRATLESQGIIIDNIDKVISNYRNRMGYLFQGTSLHILVLTKRCNLSCVYCHAEATSSKSKKYDMDKETATKAVDLLFQSPSQAVTIEFQGGEPLLNFDVLKHIVEYAKEKNETAGKNLQFSLVTNLTKMTDQIFSFLKKNNIGICTSLDGCRKVHEKNRADYDATVKWIKKIRKDHTVNAMLLATKHTLPYPKEVVDEYFNLGLEKIWIKPVNKIGHAADNWNTVGFTADEYLEFWKKAMEHIIEKNKKRAFVEVYSRIILRKMLTNDNVNFTDLQSPCGAAIGQLAYNYDGQVYTCDEGKLFDIFNLGTVDDDYSTIVTGAPACTISKASINDNPMCDSCAYKPYCGLCPVCSYAETNNIIPDMPDRRCRILMGMFDFLFDKIVNDEKARKVLFDWVKTRI